MPYSLVIDNATRKNDMTKFEAFAAKIQQEIDAKTCKDIVAKIQAKAIVDDMKAIFR